MFACSNEVFGIVAPCQIPVCAQLAAGFQVKGFWEVGFWVDGEVCVAEFVGPFVIRRGDDDGWDFGRGDEVS